MTSCSNTSRIAFHLNATRSTFRPAISIDVTTPVRLDILSNSNLFALYFAAIGPACWCEYRSTQYVFLIFFLYVHTIRLVHVTLHSNTCCNIVYSYALCEFRHPSINAFCSPHRRISVRSIVRLVIWQWCSSYCHRHPIEWLCILSFEGKRVNTRCCLVWQVWSQ